MFRSSTLPSMPKAAVARLFVGAVLAEVVGVGMALAAVVAALAGGAITIGGPDVVAIDGGALAGTLVWLAIASVVVVGGELATLASWIGALLNTWRLDDRTWFLALLVLGLLSFGWLAMVAYVIAGPDGTRHGALTPRSDMFDTDTRMQTTETGHASPTR